MSEEWYGGNPTVNEAIDSDIAAAATAGPHGPQVAPAVPASGTVLANPFSNPVTVYVAGGTVTVVAVNGTATGVVAGAIRVPVGESITLTYSVAPTWTWFCD